MPRAQIGQESMSRLGPFGPSSPHLRNLRAGIANCIFLIYGQQWAPAASPGRAAPGAGGCGGGHLGQKSASWSLLGQRNAFEVHATPCPSLPHEPSTLPCEVHATPYPVSPRQHKARRYAIWTHSISTIYIGTEHIQHPASSVRAHEHLQFKKPSMLATCNLRNEMSAQRRWSRSGNFLSNHQNKK